VQVAIECSVVEAEGGDRVLMTVDGRPVATTSLLDIPVGPYDKAGLLIGSDKAVGSATYDDMLVHVGETYAQREAVRDPDRPSE
jgi:hypothetical protein